MSLCFSLELLRQTTRFLSQTSAFGALRRKGRFKASRSESFCDMLRRMSWGGSDEKIWLGWWSNWLDFDPTWLKDEKQMLQTTKPKYRSKKNYMHIELILGTAWMACFQSGSWSLLLLSPLMRTFCRVFWFSTFVMPPKHVFLCLCFPSVLLKNPFVSMLQTHVQTPCSNQGEHQCYQLKMS